MYSPPLPPSQFESLELCRSVLAQGRKQLLAGLATITNATTVITISLFQTADPTLALSVYLRANGVNKVAMTLQLLILSMFLLILTSIQEIQCYAETAQFQNIVLYAKKIGYTPNYVYLNGSVMRVIPGERRHPHRPKPDHREVVFQSRVPSSPGCSWPISCRSWTSLWSPKLG